MNRAKKILRYFIYGSGIIIIVLAGIAALYGNRVAGLIIGEINNRSEFTISAEKVRLSLLRRFPRASVEANNIVVKSPVAVNNNDTIISASAVSLEFRPVNILRKKYIVEWVSISDGSLYLLTDSAGNSNLPDSRAGEERDTVSDVSVDLRNIRINSLYISNDNQHKGISSSLSLRSARLSGKYSDKETNLRADGTFILLTLETGGVSLGSPVDGKVSAAIDTGSDTVRLARGSLNLGTMSFQISGFYAVDDSLLSLAMSSENAPLKELSGFIPERFGKWNRLRPQGSISASLSIYGKLSARQSLKYDAAFSLSGVSVDIPGTSLRLRESSVAGFYTNGAEKRAATSELVIEKLDVRAGNSALSGTFRYSDFTNPFLEGQINGSLDFSDVRQTSTGIAVTGIDGDAVVSMSFRGRFPGGDSSVLRSAASLNPKGNVWLSSVSFKTPKYKLEDITGNLMIAGNLWADSLSMSVNGQRLLWNGEVGNFTSWIMGDASIVSIRGSLASPSFSTLSLLSDGGRSPEAGETGKRFRMPDGYNADIAFTAGEFVHGSFKAWDASGRIRYSNRRLMADNVSMTTQGGKVSGSGYLEESATAGFMTEASVTLSGINIRETFSTFNNFGQDFILSGNLGGDLSGSFSMRMRLDSTLAPSVSTLSSEGRFVIDNGELINFQPVMNMSKFIEISELRDIKFLRLENDFFIRESVFAIPQMEIRSSAADLGVSGRYNFSGDYEFHLRVLLSQILSGKAPGKAPNNEFGIVEDDGLGRTTLYLVVSHTGSKDVIAYDTRAVKAEVREDLQREKQTLKGILKEEFGWYGRDTAVVPPQNVKPKFRIMWDEGIKPDSVVTDTTVKEQKGGRVKSIFNKIIKGQPGEYLP